MTEPADTRASMLRRGRKLRQEDLEAQAAHVDELTARFDKMRDRFDHMRDRLDKMRDRLDRTLQRQKRDEEVLKLDLRRALQQLAALEERVERIEGQEQPLTSGPGDEVEARSVLDEVRREHEQVRARFQVVTSYEERLRRVEAAVRQIPVEDARHPL